MNVRRRRQSENNNSETNEPQQSENIITIVWEHLAANKLELFHQLTRILSLCFSIFCFLSAVQAGGQWNTRVTRYQKALLSGACSHSLSMYIAVNCLIPVTGILSMDPLHYLIYCYILCTSQPSLVALIPLCIWNLLDLTDYFYNLLIEKLSTRHHLMQFISWVRVNREPLLQISAYFEIAIAVIVVPWIFICDINFLVLIYYKFLQLRYQSQSSYSRKAFRQCRQVLESISQQRQCPEKVKELIEKIIESVSNMSPTIGPTGDN